MPELRMLNHAHSPLPQNIEFITAQYDLKRTILQSTHLGENPASARDRLIQCLQEAKECIVTVLENEPFRNLSHLELENFDRDFHEESQLIRLANFLMQGYLNPFKALVFNGQDSIQLAVGGNRLKKISRRLYDAVEQFTAVYQSIDELQFLLAKTFPGYPSTSYQKAAKSLLILNAWGKTSRQHQADSLFFDMAQSLLKSTMRDGRVRLGLFVCPPVDFSRLSGKTPEQYLGINMHGSVLSRHIAELRHLFGNLESAGIHIELSTFIGDTDEEDYLWQGIARPHHLDEAQLEIRRKALVHSVKAYLSEEVSRGGKAQPRVIRESSVQVLRFSAMSPSKTARSIYQSVIQHPLKHFTKSDIEAERIIMERLWQPGVYYDGLTAPEHSAMTKIIVHKFATYAMQGVMLWDHDSDIVLIQTERPPLLRSKMLNAGRTELRLPSLAAVNLFDFES